MKTIIATVLTVSVLGMVTHAQSPCLSVTCSDNHDPINASDERKYNTTGTYVGKNKLGYDETFASPCEAICKNTFRSEAAVCTSTYTSGHSPTYYDYQDLARCIDRAKEREAECLIPIAQCDPNTPSQ